MEVTVKLKDLGLIFVLAWVSTSLVTTVGGSKILVMISTPSPSHFNVYFPVLQELVARNHDVTLLSYHMPKTPIPKLKTIRLRTVAMDGTDMNDFISKTIQSAPITKMLNARGFSIDGCQTFITDNATQKMISEGQKFDLAIVDEVCAECTAAVAHVLARHAMYLCTTFTLPRKRSNVPASPSHVPLFFDHLSSKMNFWQRLQNLVNTIGVQLVNTYIFNREMQQILNQHVPQAPTIEESESKIAFRLVNADPVMESPRPSLPNVIAVGGMHCVEAKPLPKELKEFVDQSGNDGFIVFGLGTNVKGAILTPEFVHALLTVFSKLKQRVVWKYEENIENVPQNVKVTKWLPQQDLLGHPKIRLFITHAGLLSLQEAIYHAVPVVTIPFFADQPGNAARVEELKIGKRIHVWEVTADRLHSLITETLTEKSYKENVKKYSSIFRDQSQKSIDRAIFWIEYVIRHDGARHLRTAGEDLIFVQYFLLDVIAFVVCVGIISVTLPTYLIKFAVMKFYKRTTSSKSHSKQN